MGIEFWGHDTYFPEFYPILKETANYAPFVVVNMLDAGPLSIMGVVKNEYFPFVILSRRRLPAGSP